MTLYQQALHDCDTTPEDLAMKLLTGSRCVRYVVCVSFLIATVQKQTPLKLCSSPSLQYLSAIPASVASMIFGWWALPWGPLLTVRALWINLNGGEDVTDQVYSEYCRVQEEKHR
jgi:hypothetical protein